MARKVLDQNGLLYLWRKIANTFAKKGHTHQPQTSVTGNAGTATTLETARTIDGVSFNGSANIVHYGVSSTVAATATKTVTLTSDFTLATGAWIAVKFSITNTADVDQLKLDVNSTGAKAIKYRGGDLPATSILSANRLYLFVYDGTNYELIGDLDTNTGAEISSVNVTGNGNAITGITASGGTLSATKNLTFIEASEKGTANGICPLNANSKIDTSYLPSYVDDVIEVYPISGATQLSAGWLTATQEGSTAITPQSGVIYILMADTTSYDQNSQFRWGGSTYVKMNDGGVTALTNAEIDTAVQLAEQQMATT